MPSRLSKLFSASDKEKEALAEAQRNRTTSESPPPGYAEAPPEYDREHTLQPPDVTAGFSNLSISSTDGFPQPNETIAHLKLLECFYRLKQTVGRTNGLFGIDDDIVTRERFADEAKTSECLARLAEKRWAIYLHRAVDRFEKWWTSITPGATMITRSTLESEGSLGTLADPSRNHGTTITLSRTNLPPVDVLMVWHAYMLNPRAYLEDCLRHGRMPLWHTPMPWQAVAECIDSETFVFNADEQAQQLWTGVTELPWDNLSNTKSMKILFCPVCSTKAFVPWTTASQSVANARFVGRNSKDALIKELDMILSTGHGFCDRDFKMDCIRCQHLLSHENLRVGKFCNDLKKLVDHDVPLGGTILGNEGIPFSAFGKKDISSATITRIPNELFRAGLGQATINSYSTSGNGIERTVSDIRAEIEQAMSDHKYMRVARNSHSHRLLRTEKVAIRKMMSRYWNNSSPFALDLVGAVIRQGSFIEKMHNIDWLHSPALPNTMRRLINKYSVFMKIMADYPSEMAVPTLDVDLAWHTHQLSPYRYMEYTVDHTRQFIDHDDKVAETKLNDSFAWTSKTYQKLTGQPYSECTCWYCEAIRESHTSSASRLFNTSSAQAADMLHQSYQDPRKSVHISAHNAVRTTGDDATYVALSKTKADQLEKHYQKACERARKKGKPVPRRDDYYYSDAWGYPVYIPAYSPYIGFYPYAPMYYPVTPGCMAVGAGASGACCTGTCGGGVAAGACGAAGSAGCAGGSAGGCGSSGGAGGCGSGGGCGGGGC